VAVLVVLGAAVPDLPSLSSAKETRRIADRNGAGRSGTRWVAEAFGADEVVTGAAATATGPCCPPDGLPRELYM